MNRKLWLYDERRNLQALRLPAGVIIPSAHLPIDFISYLDQQNDKNTHKLSMQKYNMKLIRCLQDLYNFTLKLYRFDSWGYLHHNKFNGFLQQMENGKLELSASSFFFRMERYRAADFTMATWLARSTFVFINPHTAMRMVFLQPLDIDVWYTLIICIVFINILLYITIVFEYKKYKQNLKRYNSDSNTYNDFCNDNTITFITVTIIGAFSQQGFALVPKLLSSRIIVFWTLLSSVIIYQFYSASIVSTLLMAPPVYIKNLRDLIDSNLKMGIEDLPYNRDYFNKTSEPIEVELYNKLLMQTSNNENAIFLSAQEGLERVLDGNYAFNGDISAIYPLIVKEFPEYIVCQLSEVQLVPSYLQHMAIVVQKQSPYKEMITFGLKRLKETGIMSRLLQIYTHEKPPCGQSISRIPSVELDAFIPALVLLFIGICFAVIILLFEFIWVHKIPRDLKHFFQKFQRKK